MDTDELEEGGRETREITGDEDAEPVVGAGELGREEFLSALRRGGESEADIYDVLSSSNL